MNDEKKLSVTDGQTDHSPHKNVFPPSSMVLPFKSSDMNKAGYTANP